MIMRGQDIYSSGEETTSSPSSSGSEDEVRGEESSEEVYPHEEGGLLWLEGSLEANLVIYLNLKDRTSFIQDAKF